MRGCPGDEIRSGGMMETDDVECPNCGNPIEFFANDRSRRCSECGDTVDNPALGQAETEAE